MLCNAYITNHIRSSLANFHLIIPFVDPNFKAISYFLCKTNNAVHFSKADTQVECKTGFILQLTVAGKFFAVFLLCPRLTCAQKHFCDSPVSVSFPDIDPFQISHRARIRPFHIIISQLTLGEAYSLASILCQKNTAPCCIKAEISSIIQSGSCAGQSRSASSDPISGLCQRMRIY